MDASERARALAVGARLAAEGVAPAAFRAALMAVARDERDAWLDAVLGLDELPPDDPALPRGCVPYLPAPVDALLAVAEELTADDVFVDVGCGVGRALALVHLLTGARAVGLEIQPALVAAARGLAGRVGAERIEVIEGDAELALTHAADATVFFLYCPFSGARLERFLDRLALIAPGRALRLCALDVPLPARPWFALVARAGGLETYRGVPPRV